MGAVRPRGRRLVCMPEDVVLRPATRADDRFLYQLLAERYARPDTNIEGMALPRLPTYAEHVRHLDGRPYPELDVIVVDGEDVGIVFLNRARAIGCFVLADHIGRGVGVAAVYVFLLRCERPVYAHVNARNRAASRSAERLGFVLTEETPERIGYELLGAPRDLFGDLRRRRSAAPEGEATDPAARPAAEGPIPPGPIDVRNA